MVPREFFTMAKKKSPENPSAPAAPARRRAPSKKTAAASAPGNGNPEPTRAEIAEAAYYRHLNRGGSHGDEFTDWIEAERELKQRHSR
jgi:hypothetical protein